MKKKINTITALIFGAVLAANFSSLSADSVEGVTLNQTTLSGAFSVEGEDGTDVSAFSQATLDAEGVTLPLGETVIGETTAESSITEGTVNAVFSATATNANATALDLEGGYLSTAQWLDAADIEGDVEDVAVTVGEMAISAEATSTGGNATAINGSILNEGSGVFRYTEIYNEDQELIGYEDEEAKYDAGALNLNAKATATSTYDAEANTWTDANATGIYGSVSADDISTASINVEAISNGGNAVGVEWGIYGELQESDSSADISVSAKAYSVTDEESDEVKASGNATAINGYVDLSRGMSGEGGTYNVNISAESEDGTAMGVAYGVYLGNENIDLTIDAKSTNSSATAVGGWLEGGSSEYVYVDEENPLTETSTGNIGDSVLVNISATAENGIATAIEGDIDIYSEIWIDATSAISEDYTTEDLESDIKKNISLGSIELNGEISATGKEAIAINGDIETESSVEYSYYNEETGYNEVEVLSSVGDVNANITATGTNSVEVEAETADAEAAMAYSSAMGVDGDVEANLNGEINVSATAIAKTINLTDTDTEDEAISNEALTEYTAAAAEATAIDGTLEGNLVGGIYVSAIANAEVSESIEEVEDVETIYSNTAGYATAYGIGANIEGDISGTLAVSAIATGYYASAEATGIGENIGNGIVSEDTVAVKGDITGNIVAYAEANGEYAEADAAGIDGDVEGNISGSVSAYAVATGENSIATAIAIDGGVDGDISGNIYAYAESSSSTAIAINAADGVIGNISGNISAEAIGSTAKAIVLPSTTYTQTVVYDEDGEVVSDTIAYDTVISGDISAIAQSVDGSVATATAIGVTAASTYTLIEVDSDGKETITENINAAKVVLTFEDGSSISAIEFDDEGVYSAGTAINAGTRNLETIGDITVEGDINAGSLDSYGSLSMVGGTINVNTMTVDDFSMSFDINGELTNLDNVTFDYREILNIEADIVDQEIIVNDPASTAEEIAAATAMITELKSQATSVAYSKISSLATANATTLVGDNDTFTNTYSNAFDYISDEDELSLIGEDGLTIEASNMSYNIAYDDTTDIATVKVTSTSYFQDKALDSNSMALAAKLDAVELATTTYDPATATQEEMDAEDDAVATTNSEARATKLTADSMSLEAMVPHANSYLSKMNADSLANLNMSNVWRMQSLMADRANFVSANADAETPATPENKVASFQSVNLIGSQDGGSNSTGYDFYSTGGTADMDYFFGDNLLAGFGIGGIYNKVEGDSYAGNSESTSFVLDFYAMYAVDAFEVFASLGYAHSFNEADNGSAHSEWDSDSFYLLAGLAYAIEFEGGFTLKPMLLANLVYQNHDDSASSGGGAYDNAVNGTSYTNFKTYLGLEAEYAVSEKLELNARVFWTHEFGDDSYDMAYTNSTISPLIGSINYAGEKIDRDGALLGLGISYKFTDSITGYFDYNANVSGDYIGHNLNAALSLKF